MWHSCSGGFESAPGLSGSGLCFDDSKSWSAIWRKHPERFTVPGRDSDSEKSSMLLRYITFPCSFFCQTKRVDQVLLNTCFEPEGAIAGILWCLWGLRRNPVCKVGDTNARLTVSPVQRTEQRTDEEQLYGWLCCIRIQTCTCLVDKEGCSGTACTRLLLYGRQRLCNHTTEHCHVVMLRFGKRLIVANATGWKQKSQVLQKKCYDGNVILSPNSELSSQWSFAQAAAAFGVAQPAGFLMQQTRRWWSVLPKFWIFCKTGWWFQIFFSFTPIWGRFPFWLIFFNGVETTN